MNTAEATSTTGLGYRWSDLSFWTVTEGEDLRLARLDLVAQDGTLWRALPRMGWAEYGVGSDGAAKGVRLHLRFHLVKDVPCEALITRGKFCERKAFRQMLKRG